MRSFWYFTLLQLCCLAQAIDHFQVYQADPPPIPTTPDPVCDAGNYLTGVCRNHHLAVGLSASRSKYFHSVEWFTSHSSFMISSPGKTEAILKLRPGHSVCDDKVVVTLVVWSKDKTKQDTCKIEVGVSDTVRPTFTADPADETVDCDDVPNPVFVSAKDDCDKVVNVELDESDWSDHGDTTIERVWTATDTCGNVNVLKQKIFIQDTEAPELVGVPESTTADCDNIPKPCAVVAYDNCDEYDEVDYEEATITGDCPGEYEIHRTWSAMDRSYNTVSGKQIITVSDTSPPQLLGVPSVLSFNCDAVPSMDDYSVTALDNCDDDVQVQTTTQITNQPCEHEWSGIWKWFATDHCGNPIEASVPITVSAVSPVITVLDNEKTIECEAAIPFCEPEIDDPCSYDPELQYNEITTDNSCTDGYTIVRTWSYQDDCGGDGSVSQTIVIEDNSPPRFTSNIPAFKIVECDKIPTYNPTAVDNCDDLVTITPSETTDAIEYQVANYKIYRKWVAADNCGNTATKEQTIQVSDSSPPMIVGVPPHTTYPCDIVPTASKEDVSVIYDVCPCPHEDVTYYEARKDGDCPWEYTLIRTWIVTDCSGNPGTGVQTIHVVDKAPPILTTQQGTSAISIEDLSSFPPYPPASCDDNCGTTTITKQPVVKRTGSCSHDYKLITTWVCIDECGLLATASHTIHVFDHTPPELINLPGKYVQWECDDPRLEDYAADPILNGDSVTATDNSDSVIEGTDYVPTFVSFNKRTEPGTCDESYSIILHYVAIDDCRNTAESIITINVIDQEPPVLDVPQRKVVVDDCNIPETVVQATDNCDEVTVHLEETGDYSTIDSPCPSQFDIHREWTAVDDCGNVAAPVKQHVEVVDHTPPQWIVSEPEDETVECEYPEYTISPVAIDPNCHDNTTHLDLIYTEKTIHEICRHQYIVVRKWTASDCLGNFAHALQTITVVDETPPVFSYTAPSVTIDCEETPKPDMSAEDNCGYSVHMKYYETKDVNCEKDFTVVRKWVASDECGNTATQIQTVTVVDSEVPVIAGPQDSILPCDVTPSSSDATCTDDCSYVTMTFKSKKLDGGCPHNYVLIRTWRCEDDCGKYAVHTQTVHVTDLEPPVFDSYVPTSFTAECDDVPRGGESGITGTDNCGYPITTVVEIIPHNSAYVNMNQICDHEVYRKYVIRDSCGNSAIYFQTISVSDNTPPEIFNIPDDTTYICNDVILTDTVYATDNCDPHPEVTPTSNILTQPCTHIYTRERKWVATDHCGNSVTGIQIVHVDDHEKPEWLHCLPSYHYTSPVVTVDNINTIVPPCDAWDNCDDDVRVECSTSIEPGCTEDDYILTRVCHAYDDCGNNGYPVTQVFEVEDREPCPFDSFPEDITVSCEEDLATLYSAPTHECAFMTLASSVIAGSCEESRKVVKTWTTTDHCGNTQSQSQTITVYDNEAPTWSYINDETHECEVNLDSFITVTDNCDYNPTHTYKEVQLQRDCAHEYVVEQQWFVKDQCENSKFWARTVTVTDTTPPTVGVIPPDMTVGHQNIPPYPDFVKCNDNCPLAYVQATYEEWSVGGTCEDEYTLYRKWCCEDCVEKVCKTQTITVEDNTPPEFAYCPRDETHHINPPPQPTLSAVDGYGGEAEVTPSSRSEYSGYLWERVIIREWEAEDNCGNTDVCSQTIYITVPPPILCVPDNMTLDCEDEATIPSAEAVTQEIQDCSGDGMEITYVGEQKIGGGECDAEYCLVRTWTAIDNLKGSLNHAETYETKQTICVVDKYGPYWDFPAYRTVDCSKEAFLPNYIHVHPVVAQDDCGEVTVTYGNWSSDGPYGFHYDFTATDECGQTISERMMIQVVDMAPPQLSDKPKSMTVNCTLDGLFDNEAPITCDDNCGTPTLTTWSVILEQACHHRKKLVRGWRCVDEKGNLDLHEQTITVVDDESPEWNDPLPQDMTLECDEDLPSVPTLTASDNCNYIGYVTYQGEIHESPNQITYGTEILSIIRSWIVYDECGLFNTHSQTIRIYDSFWPQLVGIPDDNLEAECEACMCDSVTATDNCGAPSMHSWNVTEDGTCPKERTVITYWEAVDDVGHSVHDSQTIVIRDSNPPTWKSLYIENITVNCHEVPPPPENVQAIDECDPHVKVEFHEDVIQSAYWLESQLFSVHQFAKLKDQYKDTGVQYDIYRTWTATDSCGHAISKTQTVIVDDNVPPMFLHCPGDITVPCGQVPLADKTLAVTDNCADAIYVRYKETPKEGSCDDEYTLYRHWWAMDTKDNRVDCFQTIEVIDEEIPSFAYVPPAKVYVPCEEWPIPWPSEVHGNDDCSDVTIDKSETGGTVDCEDDGKYIRTWVINDLCGNSRTFTQVIIVSDTEDPVCVECPEKYRREIDCSETPTQETVTWTDNCDNDLTVDVQPNSVIGSCPEEQLWTYQYTAEDNCGNKASLLSHIKVTDTTDPTFTTDAPDISYECDFGPDYTAWKDLPTCDDDCDPQPDIVRVQGTIEGTCENDFKVIHTWTCTDACGNFVVTTATVTVYDWTPPTFSNQPSLDTIDCDDEEPTYNVIATDNCGGVFGYTTPYREVHPGTCEASVVWTYTWSATDVCGNTNSFDYTLTSQDTTPPVIVTFPDPESIYPCDDLWTVPPVTATDDCDSNVEVKHSVDGEGSYDVTSYHVVHNWWTVDNCGNKDEHTVEYDVVDNVPPVLTDTQDIDHGCKDIPPPVDVVCTDNCDPHTEVTFKETIGELDCEDEYDVIRTWTCVDNDGNSDSTEYTVHVSDTDDPVWESTAPEDMTLECDETNDYPLVHYATDICDYNVNITMDSSTTDDKCNNVTSYTWTATDNCGHAITDSWVLTIRDTTKPTLSRYPDSVKVDCSILDGYTYGGVDIQSYSDIWPGIITATDNCEYAVDVKFTLEKVNVECLHDYDLVMKWVSEDDCGNKEEHAMTVYIEDNGPPVWTSVPEDLTIDVYGRFMGLKQSIAEVSAHDDCDQFVDITATEQKFQRQYNRDCENEWLLVRTFKAEDDCGNVIYHQQSISSIDTSVPVMPLIKDTTIECDEHDESYEECDVIPISDGDDTLDVVFSSHTDSSDPCEVLVYKTWTVEDCAGHVASSVQTVTVKDSTPPILSRDMSENSPMYVECVCDEIPEPATVKAYDNCDEVTVVFDKDENRDGSTCEGEYSLTYTWTSQDSCGNEASTQLQIFVTDTEAPEFCIPEDQSYAVMPCENGEGVVSPSLPEAYDDCDDEPQVVMTDHWKTDEQCEHGYTRVFEYSASDDCGNSDSYEMSIVIDDNQPPSLVDDSRLCLFISYGESWGTWAAYRIDGFFALTDDCDSAPTLDELSFKCNVTDDSSYVEVPKTTSVGSSFNEDCYVMSQGNELMLVVRIDRQWPSSSAVLGRTYHIHGIADDDCANQVDIRRDIFIPRDRTIYEHVQPCSSGDPIYYNDDPPYELNNNDDDSS